MYHIYAINQVIKKFAEYNKPLYTAFIVREQASDSMYTATVVEALRDQGIRSVLGRHIRGCSGTIILHKKIEEFSMGNGVRQRDTLSPKFLTACLTGVFSKLDAEKSGIRVN